MAAKGASSTDSTPSSWNPATNAIYAGITHLENRAPGIATTIVEVFDASLPALTTKATDSAITEFSKKLSQLVDTATAEGLNNTNRWLANAGKHTPDVLFHATNAVEALAESLDKANSQAEIIDRTRASITALKALVASYPQNDNSQGSSQAPALFDTESVTTSTQQDAANSQSTGLADQNDTTSIATLKQKTNNNNDDDNESNVPPSTKNSSSSHSHPSTQNHQLPPENANEIQNPEPSNIQLDSESIDECSTQLSVYLEHLTGEKQCSKDQLQAQRLQLLNTLRTDVLEHFRQLGVQTGGPAAQFVESITKVALRELTDHVGKTFTRVTGFENPLMNRTTEAEDVDEPPNPIEDEEQSPGASLRRAREGISELTLFSLVRAGYDFIQNGWSFEASSRNFETLAKALNYLKQKSNAQDSPELGLDLDHCIDIASRAKHLSESAGQKAALEEIAQIMERHPIAMGPFQFQIPLSANAETEHSDPFEMCLAAMGPLNNHLDDPHLAPIDYEKDNRVKMAKVESLGSYTLTYMTVLNWFCGTPKHTTGETQTQCPALIQTIQGIDDLSERRTAFIKALRDVVWNRKDVNIINRALLWAMIPIVQLACETAIKRFSMGILPYVEKGIDSAKSNETNTISTTPINLFKRTFAALSKGKIYAANHEETIDEAEALKDSVQTEGFLRGHKDIPALCKCFGDVIVDKLMQTFKPFTTTLDNWDKTLWNIQAQQSIVLEVFLSLFTVPLRGIVWVLNKGAILLESGINKILNVSVKWILSNTTAVELSKNLSVNSLFPDSRKNFSETSDSLLLIGLRNLNRLYISPKPTDESQKFEKSPESTRRAIKECILVVLGHIELLKLAPDEIRSQTNRILNPEEIAIRLGSNYLKHHGLEGSLDVCDTTFQILMSKDILNQLLSHSLDALIGSMSYSQTNTPSEADIEKQKKAQKSRSNEIQHYIHLLLAKTIKLSTAKILNPSKKESPITNHIREIREGLLGADVDIVQPRSTLPSLSRGQSLTTTSPEISPPRPLPASNGGGGGGAAAQSSLSQESHSTTHDLASSTSTARPQAPEVINLGDGLIATWKKRVLNATQKPQHASALPLITDTLKELREIYERTSNTLPEMEFNSQVGGGTLNTHRKDIADYIKKLDVLSKHLRALHDCYLENCLPPKTGASLLSISQKFEALTHQFNLLTNDNANTSKDALTSLESLLQELIEATPKLYRSDSKALIHYPTDLTKLIASFNLEIGTLSNRLNTIKKLLAQRSTLRSFIDPTHPKNILKNDYLNSSRQFNNFFPKEIQTTLNVFTPEDCNTLMNAFDPFKNLPSGSDTRHNDFSAKIERLISQKQIEIQSIVTSSTQSIETLTRKINSPAGKLIGSAANSQDQISLNSSNTPSEEINNALADLARCVYDLKSVTPIEMTNWDKNSLVQSTLTSVQLAAHDRVTKDAQILTNFYGREGEAPLTGLIAQTMIAFLESQEVDHRKRYS